MPEKREQDQKAPKEHTHCGPKCRCNGNCSRCHCRPGLQINEKV